MKTSLLISSVLLFVSGLGVCRANLGETEAQCIARYGDESDIKTDVGYRQVGDKAASFNLKTATGSLTIRVIFLRGSSCHEVISNTDSSQGLSEDQLKAWLDSQSAGFKWSKRKRVYRTVAGITYGTVEWLRSDGTTAKFWLSGKADTQTQSGQIELATKEYTYAQHIYDQENGDN